MLGIFFFLFSKRPFGMFIFVICVTDVLFVCQITISQNSAVWELEEFPYEAWVWKHRLVLKPTGIIETKEQKRKQCLQFSVGSNRNIMCLRKDILNWYY